MLGCDLSDAHDINVTPRALIKCASSSQTFLYRSFRKRRTIDEITQWATYAEAALRVGVQHPAFLALSRSGAIRNSAGFFGVTGND